MRQSLLLLTSFSALLLSVGCAEQAITGGRGDFDCEKLTRSVEQKGLSCVPGATEKSPPIDRFENDILEFESADQISFPADIEVLFLSSSSIRLWNIEKSFPDLKAINRGYGGSCINESVYYFDRIVLPYEPEVIVFYAGDNDIALGKSPEMVFDDFKQFAETTKVAFPRTRIIYIAIKPSIARWQLWPCMKLTNCLIAQFCEADLLLDFMDISPVMLNDNGQPRRELFQPDGLHLNEEGYQLWNEILKAHLSQAEK